MSVAGGGGYDLAVIIQVTSPATLHCSAEYQLSRHQWVTSVSAVCTVTHMYTQTMVTTGSHTHIRTHNHGSCVCVHVYSALLYIDVSGSPVQRAHIWSHATVHCQYISTQPVKSGAASPRHNNILLLSTVNNFMLLDTHKSSLEIVKVGLQFIHPGLYFVRFSSVNERSLSNCSWFYLKSR